MSTAPFADRERVDARDKVRGAITYAADRQFPGLLHAMAVPARIAKGSMTEIDTAAARQVAGVVLVLTPADMPPALPPGPMGDLPITPRPTLEARIAYRGQPIALVLAETLEAAIEGAEAVRASFAPEPFASLLDSPGAVREPDEDTVTGNAQQALADAAVVVEAEYESPTQHHNPIELISTTAVWADGQLTVYEGTQNAGSVKAAVARSLGLDPAVVEVKSESVGGAFGQKGWVQRHTALVAYAAIRAGRPVKLVVPRSQIFHNATFRPNSRHRIRLGADANGKMIAARYDVEHQQSRGGGFPVVDYHEVPMRLYGIGHYYGTAIHVRTDVESPGHMRAPYEHPACFAFESAVDELSYRLDRDPLAFRIANETRIDPHNGKPLSSRFLNECLELGAQRFGWSKRSHVPGSMTEPDGTQIGWGVASGAYPALVTPAIATLRIEANGTTRFAVSGHEFGQGIRTAIAAALLRDLDIDPERLEIAIGDTAAAPQHLTAGSWGTFSVVPTALAAAARMRTAVSELLAGREIAGNLHQQLATARRPFVQIEISQLGPGQDQAAFDALRRGAIAINGPAYPDFTSMSYIAHFVEVRIEPRTRRVRVPRVVSVVDCGRVVSPRTAKSQVLGGVVWAIGHALREATETDPRYGGYLNADIAEYLLPVNADIGEIDVTFIDKPDPLANSAGVKGVGEVAMVGAAAAIANAVFHATGKRQRDLPIRVEHLL